MTDDLAVVGPGPLIAAHSRQHFGGVVAIEFERVAHEAVVAAAAIGRLIRTLDKAGRLGRSSRGWRRHVRRVKAAGRRA